MNLLCKLSTYINHGVNALFSFLKTKRCEGTRKKNNILDLIEMMRKRIIRENIINIYGNGVDIHQIKSAIIHLLLCKQCVLHVNRLSVQKTTTLQVTNESLESSRISCHKYFIQLHQEWLHQFDSNLYCFIILIFIRLIAF